MSAPAEHNQLVPARIEDASTLDSLKEHIRLIANTELVPAQYRNRPHAILAAIQIGREIGLAPFEALSDIYIPIARDGTPKGKPGLYASAMVKLARRASHSISGQVDTQKAVVRGKRADTGDEMQVTFTLKEAERRGLIRDPSQWQSNPEDMLWARAVSRLCRRLFPDALGSMPYTPEELREETPAGRLQAAVERVPDSDRVTIDEDAGEPDFADWEPSEEAAVEAKAIPFGDEK